MINVILNRKKYFLNRKKFPTPTKNFSYNHNKLSQVNHQLSHSIKMMTEPSLIAISPSLIAIKEEVFVQCRYVGSNIDLCYYQQHFYSSRRMKMLSLERKAEMIQSLKEDYVVLTDIVCEVVADTKADMLVLQRENMNLPNLEQDRRLLHRLDKEYLLICEKDQAKAVDIIEKIYELSDKYDKLRMGI